MGSIIDEKWGIRRGAGESLSRIREAEDLRRAGDQQRARKAGNAIFVKHSHTRWHESLLNTRPLRAERRGEEF